MGFSGCVPYLLKGDCILGCLKMTSACNTILFSQSLKWSTVELCEIRIMHHSFKRKIWQCQREKLSRNTESLGKLAKVARRGVNALSALMRISGFKLEAPFKVMGRMEVLSFSMAQMVGWSFFFRGQWALVQADIRIWLWISNQITNRAKFSSAHGYTIGLFRLLLFQPKAIKLFCNSAPCFSPYCFYIFILKVTAI